jgi:pyrroline-5-carboxylate reductase
MMGAKAYAFVGAGNMGRALAAALIHKKVCPPEAILLVDPDPACREAGRELGCEVEQASGDGLGAAPVVVMAVKPQTAPEVYGKVRPLLNPEQVVVSIMAGVTMSEVGLGMNVFYADPSVAAQKLEPVAALLNASGEALAVPSEDAIDAATAVSGSGPAYVFYVAEHWMKAAVKLGFDESEAATLVQQTLLGATKLWKAQNGAVSRLREQVTSKGGTTAAALESFQADSVGTGLEAGIERAYQRAKELGRGS